MTTTDDKKSGEREGGVQSLRRAMAILRIVADHPNGIALADISRLVELHNSTAFHITKTLLSIGMLRFDPGSKLYFVGTAVFMLAAAAMNEQELIRIAGPILSQLSAQTGATSHIAVRAGDKVAIIAQHDAASVIRVSERIGTLRPAYATAIGKVVLASMAEQEFARYLDEATLDPFTPFTIVDGTQLESEIARVRHRRLAIDNGEFSLDLRCFAAPVHNFRSEFIAAIGISQPHWLSSVERVRELSERVLESAAELTHALGGDILVPCGDAVAIPKDR